MKSQRLHGDRIELKSSEKRKAKRALEDAARKGQRVPVNVSSLAPNNSYGVPDFVRRGHYEDTQFTCQSCGKQEVWTATQQKWWYEVAKGFAYSTANRCRPCRRRERERKAEARKVHLEGVARKRAAAK